MHQQRPHPQVRREARRGSPPTTRPPPTSMPAPVSVSPPSCRSPPPRSASVTAGPRACRPATLPAPRPEAGHRRRGGSSRPAGPSTPSMTAYSGPNRSVTAGMGDRFHRNADDDRADPQRHPALNASSRPLPAPTGSPHVPPPPSPSTGPTRAAGPVSGIWQHAPDR